MEPAESLQEVLRILVSKRRSRKAFREYFVKLWYSCFETGVHKENGRKDKKEEKGGEKDLWLGRHGVFY